MTFLMNTPTDTTFFDLGSFSFRIQVDSTANGSITGFCPYAGTDSLLIGKATITDNKLDVTLSNPNDHHFYMKFLTAARSKFPTVRAVGALKDYILQRDQEGQQAYRAELAAAPAQWQAAMDAQNLYMHRAPDPNQTVLGKHPNDPDAPVPDPKKIGLDPAPH